jgi:negative regulator of flagellin synthesis FlgM
MGELMKVDPNLQSIVNAQSDAIQNAKTSRTQGSPNGTDASQPAGSDTVQFSSQFAEVQQLTSQLQQVPDIRTERVAMLKAQIQQGTYNPDPAKVADALLNNAVDQGGKG